MATADKLTTVAENVPKVYNAGYYIGMLKANSIIEKTITEYSDDKTNSVGQYVFYSCPKLTTINLPAVKRVENYAFYGCSKLTTINLPVATSVGSYVFQNCSVLTTINLPVATTIGTSTFTNCSALTTVNFPAAKTISGSLFTNCSALTTVDFPVAKNVIAYAFNNCESLTTIILRSGTVCNLSNKNAFNGCTLINGTGGYIYVPSSLVETYKTATNWVTYASKFRALEDYTVDGTTTGALDESKVSA